MLSSELTSQRLITDLRDHTLPYPLPKLCLCCPKLFPIAANYERGLLFPLLLLVRLSIRVHLWIHLDPCVSIPLFLKNGKWSHTETPWGSLSCEAATSCQNCTQNSTAVPSQFPADSTVVLLATKGSECAELGSVVSLRNSFRNINVSVNHRRRRHVGEAPRNPKDPV